MKIKKINNKRKENKPSKPKLYPDTEYNHYVQFLHLTSIQPNIGGMNRKWSRDQMPYFIRFTTENIQWNVYHLIILLLYEMHALVRL